jgi:hypothetical protein
MPLSINPFVSAIKDLAINTAISGDIRANQSVQAAVYAAGVARNVINRRNAARNAGADSGLNGQTEPASRARGLNQLNNAVQNQVDLQSNATIDEITQVSNQQVAIARERLQETIVSGGISADAFDSVLNTLQANIVQAARSANLPKVDLVSLLTAEANNFDWGDPETVVRAVPIENGDWRVRIYAPLGLGEIVFPVLPQITLSHKANYKEDNLVHTNYQFLSYRNSQPDDIQITCEWPVETPDDAEDWLNMVLLGRSLTKMFYGASENLGNPPPICTLRGYSGNNNGIILPDTPVVIKNFSFDLKDDVNYIEYLDNYVPRLSSITMTCTVIYNRNSQRAFNFNQYRRGDPGTPIRY